MTDLDEDFGPTLWIVNSIFIVMAVVAVAGRFAARLMRKMPIGPDDWMICVALLWDCVLYAIFIGCEYLSPACVIISVIPSVSPGMMLIPL